MIPESFSRPVGPEIRSNEAPVTSRGSAGQNAPVLPALNNHSITKPSELDSV
jgi:hypothetical protein